MKKRLKLPRNPADPTPEERAKHDMCHLPFRAWCPICVEARATEDPHYRSTAEEMAQGNSEICKDYCKIDENPKDKKDKQRCIVLIYKWNKFCARVLACPA